MKHCPFCAEDIQDAAIVCRHCGLDLRRPAQATTAGPRWGVIGLVVVVVLGVGVWILSNAVDQQRAQPKIAALRLAQRIEEQRAQSTRYFQRMLITFGNDSSSEFWGDLASLALNGRKLQTLSIDEAYALAHAEAARVGDAAVRRKMFLTLFNEIAE